MNKLTAVSSTDDAPPGQLSAIYVAPDCTDYAVQRRVRGFLASGVGLISFSFRRRRYNVDFVPDWPNVELGITKEQRLLARVFELMRAIRVMYGHRESWREASFLCARNLDLALLALFGKALTRCHAAFVYEVLDIHPAFTRRGIRSVLLRWLERRVLARSQLLVVSSPAFLRQYFEPVQQYRGASFLLENKWPSGEISGLSRKLPYPRSGGEPIWTIGWFGNIRCPQSLEILTELADALPRRVRIYIRGCASLLGEEKLLDVIRQRENMVFEGEYHAPQEFADIYSKVHFNWCVDLCGGKNSLWLLPNRLYEGGYFGIPALAIASHETGRVVSQRKLGISLETPVTQQLIEIMSKLSYEDYDRMRHAVENLPEENFVDHGDLSQLLKKLSQRSNQRGKLPRTRVVPQEGVA